MDAPLLVLDFGLDIVDGVARLDLERDGLARQRLDKDLHPTTETEHCQSCVRTIIRHTIRLTLTEMECALLLDVVVGEGATVFELLAREDKALLVGRDALLILDLGLDVVNCVRGLDLKSDRLAGKGLNKDLHGSEDVLLKMWWW